MQNPTENPNNSLSGPTEGTLATLVVPVIEEQLVVTREVEQRGLVRLTKQVHTHDEPLALELHHDEVTVERIPVDQFVPDGAPLPTTRHEGDTQIIPVLREVVVTRVLVVEEIRLTKRQVTTMHAETVALRREEVQIERLPPSIPTGTP